MIRFIPAWKDDSDNRIIFPGKINVFDTYNEAHTEQIGNFMFYIPFGFRMAGIVEVDIDEEGNGGIPHVAVKVGMLGHAICISGPLFDEIKNKPLEKEGAAL